MSLREYRWAIEEFHAAYAAGLDRGEIETWPDFFTEDAVYRVTARDNAEAGLRLDLMSCEGIGMLRDRAFAIAHTEMFAPRYVQHQVSVVQVLSAEEGVGGTLIAAEANYLLLETLIDEPTRILQAGRYKDQFLLRDGVLKLRRRQCVFDTVLVPNCMVYPA
jgi:3-phenylpropionate/cinnamic acid dioxygenase small subunit